MMKPSSCVTIVLLLTGAVYVSADWEDEVKNVGNTVYKANKEANQFVDDVGHSAVKHIYNALNEDHDEGPAEHIEDWVSEHRDIVIAVPCSVGGLIVLLILLCCCCRHCGGGARPIVAYAPLQTTTVIHTSNMQGPSVARVV